MVEKVKRKLAWGSILCLTMKEILKIIIGTFWKIRRNFRNFSTKYVGKIWKLWLKPRSLLQILIRIIGKITTVITKAVKILRSDWKALKLWRIEVRKFSELSEILQNFRNICKRITAKWYRNFSYDIIPRKNENILYKEK